MLLKVFLVLFVSIFSVWAWQISGKVTDIRGKAIPEAQVCVKGSTSNCVTTGTNGTFSTSGAAVGLLPERVAQSSSQTFDLVMRGGKLFLDAPANGLARLEWFNSAGRRLASEDMIILTKGKNSLDMAPSLSGVLFLRLSSGNFCRTWEMAVGGIVDRAIPESHKNGQMVLCKDAAAPLPVITASKAGFKSRDYYAINSTQDTLAWIMLATTEDDTTYKLEGTSYALSAMPPNQLVGAVTYACYAPTCAAGVFSGKKVGYLGTKGSAIYNNVYAPKDSTFLVTVGYECASNDAHSNCSLKPGAKTNACRPIQFKINGQTFPTVLWTECEAATDWCHDLFDSIPLPLKAGLNSIELYTNISDLPDMDRLIVKDGRIY